MRRVAGWVGLVALAVVGATLGSPHVLAAVDPASLVKNGDLEQGSGPNFTCFQSAGYGSSATYSAAPGRGGTGRAAQLTIGAYSNGDRKFLQTLNDTCAPQVTAGRQYNLKVWYTSTIAANLTVFRHTAAGWQYWFDFDQSPPASVFTQRTAVTPVIPTGTDQISWGMGLSGVGTLVLDDFEMSAIGAVAPSSATTAPGSSGVRNGTLADGIGVPTCFQTSGYGSHTVQQGMSADVPAGATGRSWRIQVDGYASGDRKLLQMQTPECAPTVTPGKTYDVSVSYTSSSPSNSLTLFRLSSSGWQYWTDIKALPATATWTRAVGRTPVVPADTNQISFGISTSSNGTLQTTGYGVAEFAPTAPAPAPAPQVLPVGTGGRWTTVTPPGNVRGLHATLLKDGRVLLIAGSGNQASDFAAGTFRTLIWTPSTNVFKEIPTPADMFCSGHVTLPDGRILVAGGNASYPGLNGEVAFKGAKFSHIFDPATDSFTRIGDMTDAHWYPTLTKIENGDVWAAGGIDANANGTVITEMYSGSQQRWLGAGEVPQTYTYWGGYPHMYLLGDGRLFYAGAHTFGANRPGSGASLYDWRTGQIGDVPGLRSPGTRDQAGSVLLPPAQNQTVLIAGGGDTEHNAQGTDQVDLVNLNAAQPSYVPGPTLPGGPRGYVNLVTLPDRTVLATGGATGNRGPAVLSSSVYAPTTNSWRAVTADPVGRGYHSSALLLPDGRVAVFGGNPADNTFEFRISVFEPSYLFGGTRPTVAGPPEATYGQNLTLAVTGNVASASLTSPSSATHQADSNARLVDLPISEAGPTRNATIPANRALLPPGPYMLTVVDTNGVPSPAKWINIR